MSLFPYNKTPKPRALLMFILGLVLLAAGVAGFVLLSPASILIEVPGGALLGWFGMEFFCGDGPE
jgi:hypothetical protein